MSFDPYGPNQPTRQPGDQPPAPQPSPARIPPDGTPPVEVDVNALNVGGQPDQAARNKVMLPGIFLIVLGVFNLLWVLVLGSGSYFYSSLTPEVWKKAKGEMNARQLEQIEKMEADLARQGHEIVPLMNQVGRWMGGFGVVSLLTSLVMILGGARMMVLRSYALCMFASVLAAVPCVSGCCLVGQIVGIWGAVVLMGDDVRRSFR